MRIIDLEELEKNLKKADAILEDLRPQIAMLHKVVEDYFEKRNVK
jgi:cellobiose-specific phosphotransferase system component IIB